MFERFTDAARAAMVYSQEAAHDLNHTYIGTEHFLLGLLARPDTMAARTLAKFGVSRDSVRRAVIARVGLGDKPTAGHLPFTPQLKSMLERSLSESTALRNTYIGTEHLLLALLAEPDGIGAQIVADQARNLAKVRKAVLDLLSGPSPEESELGPAEIGRRSMLLRVTEDRLTLEVSDPTLVELARAAAAAIRGQVAEPDTIPGELPSAADLAAVWQSLRHTLDQVRRQGPAEPGH